MHVATAADERLMDCMAVGGVLHTVHLTPADRETYTDSCRVAVGMTMSSIPAMWSLDCNNFAISNVSTVLLKHLKCHMIAYL